MSKKIGGSAELKAKLFSGFGDASRLSILESLRSGVKSVSEIVQETGLSQSNVSNHLGCLRECGLVKASQNGRFVEYEITCELVAKLLSTAEKLLEKISGNIDDCSSYFRPKKQLRRPKMARIL